MNLRYKKLNIIGVISVLVLSLIFTGCEQDDGSNYIFKYDISSNPRTLDPQTATDSEGLLLIANIFQGLLQLNLNGDVENAVAESYTVSEDGLIYRFKLREDVFWTDGYDMKTQCTAHDFVFAFQRLFKPSTKSDNAADFYCIKNSRLINNGSIPDLTQLGVVANDDFNLTITLDYPNPMFPVLLTTSPAMPCNEEYYNKTEGKYGLYADQIASNGAFYVYSWTYDKWNKDGNNLILRRNNLNSSDGEDKIYPYGLNFFIDETSPYQNFIDGSAHTYVATGEEAQKLIDEGYTYSENQNTSWGLVFNINSIFSNSDLRNALAYSMNRNDTELNEVGYEKSYALIPSAIEIGTTNFRSYSGVNNVMPYDSQKAVKYFESAKAAISPSALNGISIIAPENKAVIQYLSYIQQDWQAELNFFCNVKTMSDSEYQTALQNGDFTIALVNLSGDYNSPSSYLKKFTRGDRNNYYNYYNSEFEQMLTRAERAVTTDESLDYYHQSERMLLFDAIFLPLCYQTEYVFLNHNCSDIFYNPFSKAMIYRYAKYLES